MDGAYFTIDPGRLAVVLMDMQNRFLDNAEKWALIQSQVVVIEYCRKTGIPVIVVEYEGFGETNWRLIEALGHGWERRRVVRSSSNDAFVNSELGNMLATLGVTTILIMGINACSCVYQTVLSAKKRRYRILISDRLVAPNCDDHKRYLRQCHLSKDRECDNCGLRTGWYVHQAREEESRYPVFEST